MFPSQIQFIFAPIQEGNGATEMINVNIKTILIVSQPEHGKKVQEALTDASEAKFVFANSIRAAEVCIVDHLPDLIISAAKFSDGFGLSLMDLSRRVKAAPVILFSQQPTVDQVVRCIQAGVAGFFSFNEKAFAQLPETINNAVASWKANLEKKRRLESLEQANRIAKDILEAIALPMCVLNENGVILITSNHWKNHISQTGFYGQHLPPQENYLHYCESISSHVEIAEGIRAVLGGIEEKIAFTIEPTDPRSSESHNLSIQSLRTQSSNRVLLVFHPNLAAGGRTQSFATKAARNRLQVLTTRERQVMDLVVAGKPNKFIAGDLDISIKTVEMHRSNMMKKLQVDCLPDLVRLNVLADPEWFSNVNELEEYEALNSPIEKVLVVNQTNPHL